MSFCIRSLWLQSCNVPSGYSLKSCSSISINAFNAFESLIAFFFFKLFSNSQRLYRNSKISICSNPTQQIHGIKCAGVSNLKERSKNFLKSWLANRPCHAGSITEKIYDYGSSILQEPQSVFRFTSSSLSLTNVKRALKSTSKITLDMLVAVATRKLPSLIPFNEPEIVTG